MGKSCNRIICLLVLYVLSGCGVHKDQVSDTPPEMAINQLPPSVVVPIEQAAAVYDTISIVTSKTSTGRKTETVKTITVNLKPSRPANIRGAIVAAFVSQIGVREATGHNDGAKVEMFLHSVGLGRGNPWCAAFVHWCLERGGIKNNITGWSPTSVNKNNLVWFQQKRMQAVLPADVFSLYFPSLKRIGHTGFVEKDLGNNMYQTVEGNTNDAMSREGDGVYRKKRSYSATFAISRHLPDQQ